MNQATRPLRGFLVLIAAAWLIGSAPASAQTPAVPAPSGPATAASPATPKDNADPPPLRQEELDQMLAPLALYPDPLLSQVLMASTYPIEIVQADRWVKANASLKDQALTAALEKQDWDPSVKSLVNFPDLLATMSEKLELTIKIGDAFIADQKRVLDTVQKLRDKAHDAGNLKSNEQQNVTVEQAGTPTQVIVIESSDPQVVYVPAYDPGVVYGSWWYPYYPPPYYYQPPYYRPGAGLAFGLGVACGAAWGYAWGDCDWHGGDVDIDIDRNTTINNNIDRSKYKNEISQRDRTVQDGKGKWQHDSQHRKGLAYRDQTTARQYGGTSNREAVQARDSYRGHDTAGRQDLGRTGTGVGGGTSYGSAADRSQTRATTADRSSQTRSNYSGSSSALSGSRQSGQSAYSASQRGQSSRSVSSSQGSRGSYGGGGGGGRGGGGRR